MGEKRGESLLGNGGLFFWAFFVGWTFFFFEVFFSCVSFFVENIVCVIVVFGFLSFFVFFFKGFVIWPNFFGGGFFVDVLLFFLRGHTFCF
jgi:hypothetical protein